MEFYEKLKIVRLLRLETFFSDIFFCYSEMLIRFVGVVSMCSTIPILTSLVDNYRLYMFQVTWLANCISIVQLASN